ncbi:MAG: hypothetical protein M0P95_12585 [Sulfuritalea sp.]|jgi:hypothetical protein|nr:hypothetical protein [Sulfuritalea sp.]
MNVLRHVAIILCTVFLLPVLSSCALLAPPRDAYWLDPQGPRPSSDAVSLVHYALFARNLGGKPLADETERVRQAYAAEKTEFRSLQYAIVLAVPGATAADHRRALQLLDPPPKPGDGHDRELQALASLMRAHLAEYRRLEDGSHSQAQKAREEQRRAEDLEKKLEALKDIEKSLLPRDKPAGRGRAK